MLEKTPKNSLRVPFLARVFPEARFIYLYRDPRQVLSSMIEAWTIGPLPHLSAAARLDRPGVVAAARARLARADRPAAARDRGGAMERNATRLLIDDLEALPVERWTIARYDALVADPAAEIRRMCDGHWTRLGRGGSADCRLSKYTVSPPRCRQVAAPRARRSRRSCRRSPSRWRASNASRRADPADSPRVLADDRSVKSGGKKKRRPLARPPPVCSNSQTGIRTRSCRAGRSSGPARRRSAGTCCRYPSCLPPS